MLDTRAALDINILERNVEIIANALISFVFDLDPELCNVTNEENIKCSLLNGENNVKTKRLEAWLDAFAGESRHTANIIKTKKLVANFQQTIQQYADKTILFEIPIVDFVLYDVFGKIIFIFTLTILEDKLVADIVKPTVFELFLGFIICAYLYGLFYFAQKAQIILVKLLIRFKKAM